jgi:hypothetical protein
MEDTQILDRIWALRQHFELDNANEPTHVLVDLSTYRQLLRIPAMLLLASPVHINMQSGRMHVFDLTVIQVLQPSPFVCLARIE